MRIEDFSALVETIYAGSSDPAAWHALAPRLASAFGTDSATLFLWQPEGAEFLSRTANFTPKLVRQYEAQYYQLDEWVKGAQGRPLTTAFLGAELCPERRLRKSQFYSDWAKPLNHFHLIGALVEVGQFQTAAIGIHRPEHQTAFEETDRRMLQLLLPHLKQAIRIYRVIGIAEGTARAAEGALGALGVGVIFVDSNGKVGRLNHLAEQECRRGTWISVRHGTVHAASAEGSERLRAAIRTAARAAVGRGKALPPLQLLGRNGVFGTVVVLPFHPEATSDGSVNGPGAVLFFQVTDAAAPNGAKTYGEQHGLTPAERRLLEALVAGTRLSDYAEQAGITTNTVYTQLKAIFAKTGHSRQIDLVRAVEGDPLLRLADAGE